MCLGMERAGVTVLERSTKDRDFLRSKRVLEQSMVGVS